MSFLEPEQVTTSPGDTVSLWKPFSFVDSHDAVFPPPPAGSDEEYIYMNKVTVNKQQNAESQDKGRGPGAAGGLASSQERGRYEPWSCPTQPPAQPAPQTGPMWRYFWKSHFG